MDIDRLLLLREPPMKRAWLGWAGFAVLTGLFASACGKQGLGDVCSTLNGSNDCQTGLTCVPGGRLHRTYDLCCPADIASGTVTGTGACAALPVAAGSTGDGGMSDDGAANAEGGSNDDDSGQPAEASSAGGDATSAGADEGGSNDDSGDEAGSAATDLGAGGSEAGAD